ncbi:transposase [Pseudoxanthomonas wuyuanensis]|uniref:transposase n=1 Tax=Pseudoxanthomonas wuyuanensis TaxID=1073196 RepID=UPI001EE3E610|nr:transposase [Pseudoxanthomonas wuyuanensis]
MARLPRLDLPGIPQHIVQRGNNRLPCFLDSDDRQRYLQLLRKALLATGCQLHAYVLMDNHVHLLATPTAAGAVARMMQAVGRNYVVGPAKSLKARSTKAYGQSELACISQKSIFWGLFSGS